MSEYTTGELAKLTNVSVRTLQYYDDKALLKPSKIVGNGRRIYTDNDLQKLKLILLLKNLGLSLKAISEIIESDNSITVLKLLLEQQQKALKDSLKDTKEQLKTVEELKNHLPQMEKVNLTTIDDIEKIMDNKSKLRKVHLRMLGYGFLIDLVEFGTLFWGFTRHQWWPFIITIGIAIIGATWISIYYFKNTNYICPNCGTEFKPNFKEAFFAKHNPKARKLTCPACGKKDYCVEVYDEKKAVMGR
ncbi:MerR family transcriptional regulator [Companilactobacillus sp. HBUAS56257]|jgi:DNA-binding transcriptional MerR regulator/DNA-directed RNA polymerase subunit RPC12/RpoP|uniref:MerR family transcriptional regulator n=1 Tax=Companilactobacillus sp. HBUAS56257 TaxID=3109360 RepID=UPI002FEF1CFC